MTQAPDRLAPAEHEARRRRAVDRESTETAQLSGAAPTVSWITSTPSQAGALPLGELPAFHARRDPERPMLTIGNQTITRSAFEARANRRARILAERNVGQGDFVTLALCNGLEFYETSFACWKLGATPNIVPRSMPIAELERVVEIVQPKLLVGVDPAAFQGRAVLPADVAVDETISTESLPTAVAPFWKAMVSGGSTGAPKVIVDNAPGMWDPLFTQRGQLVDDTLLNPGPLYHNAPFLGMFSGLFAGSHVIDMVKFDPERTLELVDRWRVGWINLVPTMMHRIWRLPAEVRGRWQLDSLRLVFHMGAPCPAWLKRAWINWLGADRVYELYAGTERQGATLISGREWLDRPGSVGRVQPGSRIRILDDSGEEVPLGAVGEIYFLPDEGPGTTYHYLGAEPKRSGGWESLGDLGRLDEDGYLYLADRRTDLIISGGANIYPAEVEAALDAHPLVEGSVVVGLPDDDLGQRVHAVVQADGVSAEELREFLATRIARYKVPRTIELTTRALRNEAGKVRRGAIKADRV